MLQSELLIVLIIMNILFAENVSIDTLALHPEICSHSNPHIQSFCCYNISAAESHMQWSSVISGCNSVVMEASTNTVLYCLFRVVYIYTCNLVFLFVSRQNDFSVIYAVCVLLCATPSAMITVCKVYH